MTKKAHKIILIMGILFSVSLIVWLIVSSFYECAFWHVTFAQWLPIFLGVIATFFLSYYLTNKKSDYEKKLIAYESVIIKMQLKLMEDVANIFSVNMSVNQIKASDKILFYQKELLLYFRSLSNFLELLIKYKGDLLIDGELDFIKEHMESFKFEMTENISEYQTLKEKRSFAKKEMSLIDIKLDEIRLKLH